MAGRKAIPRRAWAVLLAGMASAWGLGIVFLTTIDGISYPNEFFEPLVLALFPTAFTVAAWLGLRLAGAALYVLYVGSSMAFGFGFGGPHLVVGVPLLTVGLFVLFMEPRESSGTSARTASAIERR